MSTCNISLSCSQNIENTELSLPVLSVLFIEQCYIGLLTAPHGQNKCEAMNGSVSLAVSISPENFEHWFYTVLLVALVLVVCKFL